MAETNKPEGIRQASAPAAEAKREVKALPAVATLSFEAAMAELESIVQRLEAGNVPLEESIAIYERGEALKRRCEALLGEAEARVATITRDAEGRPSGTAPLDPAG